MATIWVCKPSPEAPGDAEATEGALREMAKALAVIIGEENTLQMQTRIRSTAQGGRIVNAYEITATGWNILTTGIAGPQGFERCEEERDHHPDAGVLGSV